MGIAGMVLGIIGLALSFSLFTYLSFLFLGLAVACIATGLTLSGVSFYQAREDYGEPTGISIVGLGSGVVAFMVLIAGLSYLTAETWAPSWS